MKNIINKYIFNLWLKYCLTVFSLISVIAIFFPSIPNDKYYIKVILAIVLIICLIISYIVIVIIFKKTRKLRLKINNTVVNIFFGDIFKQKGYKVIAFNEYFDSQVDDIIISSRSLNGKLFLCGHINKELFDSKIKENNNLVKSSVSSKRSNGKTQKYKLGQIQECDEFFALSFSKFNEKNEACLNFDEYVLCLMEMWKQLNKYYSLKTINIPLLGSGITRINDDQRVSNQELLETLLYTFKICKKTFKKPAEINIILHGENGKKDIKEFDFSRIKYFYKE